MGMRMIDADALKKEWSMGLGSCNDCPQDTRRCQLDMDFTRMDICGMIDDAPTVGGWISVKDRLPEVDKSILYCAFGRSVGEGVYRGFDGRHHVWNMYAVSGTHWDNEVTHWMLLPEPPKEDKDDD